MDTIINYAITNHLTYQQLSDYLLTHKEYDDKAVSEILNSYSEYLVASANALSNDLNISI
jgi:hypothetical protein